MKKILITQPLTPDITQYTEYLKDIFGSKYLSNNGPFLIELEEKLKKHLKSKNNAVFCNGTIALMIALKSLNLKGKVITTPFTFPATVNAIEWAGLEPVFCDVDYETMNITPQKVSVLSHKNVSAILPVHVFGNPCDVYGFKELSKLFDLKIIYDAAHAFGVEIDGIPIGNFGDISMFSFHPTKLFHTGEGGMLTYNSKRLDIIIKQLRNFGIQDDIMGSIRPGINGKLNEMQSALGLCILEKINEEKEKRKNISNLYKKYLSEISDIKILNFDKKNKNSYQYFNIRSKKRNKIFEALKKNNIYARKYFYPLCTDFPHFSHIKSNVPNAEKISEEVLCLPFYGDLNNKDIERICTIIQESTT